MFWYDLERPGSCRVCYDVVSREDIVIHSLPGVCVMGHRGKRERNDDLCLKYAFITAGK